ncbi:MAG: hypothetical protein PVF69_12610, partial [Gemmatimonadota bacterium]
MGNHLQRDPDPKRGCTTREEGKMERNIIWPTALAATLVLVPAPALTQDVSGDWEVRWAQAIRVNGDGTVEIQ